jgi:hypothetical protein
VSNVIQLKPKQIIRGAGEYLAIYRKYKAMQAEAAASYCTHAEEESSK